MRSNTTAILHCLEDLSNSDDPIVQRDLAIQWIDYYWQHTSAGYIRETPPHLTTVKKRRPKPDPLLIPGEQ
jgi:hypothetical protein